MMDLVLQATLDMIAELGTVYIFGFLLFALRLLMMMENRNQFRYECAFIAGYIHDDEVTVVFLLLFVIYRSRDVLEEYTPEKNVFLDIRYSQALQS